MLWCGCMPHFFIFLNIRVLFRGFFSSSGHTIDNADRVVVERIAFKATQNSCRQKKKKPDCLGWLQQSPSFRPQLFIRAQPRECVQSDLKVVLSRILRR